MIGTAELLYAGVDAGTTRIKGTLVDEEGRTLRSISAAAPDVLSPYPGWQEVNAEEYYERFIMLMSELLKGYEGKRVVMGLSAMTPVLIPIERGGRPLINGILYNDT
ncbi:MAG: FGGY family carbohydrate kinase, partial [Nitrososphaeria archaeon]